MTWRTVASMTYGRGDLAVGTLKGWVFSVGGGMCEHIRFIQYR